MTKIKLETKKPHRNTFTFLMRRLNISPYVELVGMTVVNVKCRLMYVLFVLHLFSREIHHFCVLLGYGADAICPYLVFETVSNQRQQGK